jgi:NADH-quinone oxidoreductase subunit L
MPVTYFATLLGGLSLIGIFPLAGFWSKDEVLRHAWTGAGTVDSVAFYMLAIAVFLTAVYTTRMIWMTFHGNFRGGVEREYADASEAVPQESHGVHLAESPLVMIGPMGLLAVAAVVSGYLANPEWAFLGIDAHWFLGFLIPPGAHGEAGGGVDVTLAIVVMGIAVAGMALTLLLQRWREGFLTSLVSLPWEAGRTLLARKYYMDELYEQIGVQKFFYNFLAGAAHWFDRTIVDGAAEGIGFFSRNIGRAVSLTQTGQVQAYGVAITFGILAILLGYLIWG